MSAKSGNTEDDHSQSAGGALQLSHDGPDPGVEAAYLRELVSRRGHLTTLEDSDGSWMRLTGRGSWIEVGTDAETVRLARDDASTLGETVAEQVSLDGALAESGAWTSGDLAWVFRGHASELEIDGIEWCSDDEAQLLVPRWEAPADCLVGVCSWEIEGGGGSPGNDDSGLTYLFQIGPHFVLRGMEWTTALWGRSRTEAIEMLSTPPPGNVVSVTLAP